MNRRDFLKYLSISSLGTVSYLSAGPFSPLLRSAQAALPGKTLIVVFQRGGCDGLNVCVPYGDPDYASLRPTIGIAPPDLAEPTSAIDLDGFFGLHPGLYSFKPLYDAGHLAIFPATHYPYASQSHFDSQDFIEGAAQTDAVNQTVIKSPDGWLNRYMQVNPQTVPLRAINYDKNLTYSFRGDITVSSIDRMTRFGLQSVLDAGEEQALIDRLTAVYGQDPDLSKLNRLKTHSFGQKLLEDLAEIKRLGIDIADYVPDAGVIYPNDDYGWHFKQIAQLIKHPEVSLELATVNSWHGWDTHQQQGGGDSATSAHYAKLSRFSQSIAAFFQDLGPQHQQDVVILTCTEFGRTAKENESHGTDHGKASTWFVLGGNVNGGSVYGDWPYLTNTDLDSGRYLQYTVDYRDIIADIMVGHFGLTQTELQSIVPGHTHTSQNLFGV
jgi:uncharacterized protein (DUF1501 family)